MAWHARHVFRPPGEVRVQIRFRRTDLLYRHVGPLRDPHADARRCAASARNVGPDRLVLEVPGLPISTATGFVVGPTLLDMLDRRVWLVSELPAPAQKALLARLDPGKPPPTSVAAWSVRDLDTLWPAPGKAPRPPREPGDDTPRVLDHPFVAGLASGGTALPDVPPPSDDWIPITKLSTCLVGEYVYRLAAGVFGSVDDAYAQIAQAAADAWDADRARALRLWDLVRAAPDGVLVEDSSVLALRPSSSVSQEVERGIMREACRWLGVDPDLDLSRPRGRQRSAEKNADQGDVIRVVLADGSVTGVLLVDFEGLRAGTELHALSLPVIVSVLGALRLRELHTDVELLEAWLDAAVPDWRERVVDDDTQPPASSSRNPYEVLGVAPNAPLEDVTRAFRAAMKAVHPDTSGWNSEWAARSVIEAYKAIRAARGAAHTGGAP